MNLLLPTLLKGVLIGVCVSAPMGPIGVLCIQRTLNKGRISGLVTGIGASFSDIFYALITGLCLSIVLDFIESYQLLLKIVGSIILLGVGYYIYNQNPAQSITKQSSDKTTHTQDGISAFLLTLSNPFILFLFISLFARLNFLHANFGQIHYITAYASIFAGSLLWWLLITFLVDKVRNKFNLRSMWIMNRIIGSIIAILSLVGIVMGIVESLY